MYVIGLWLNKNLKLHTYCASTKPAFTEIGEGSTRLSWLPTFGIPPPVPCRLLKEKDNRIRSGLRGKHWLSYFAGSCKEAGECAMGHKLWGDPDSTLALHDGTVDPTECKRTEPGRQRRCHSPFLNHNQGPWHCTICEANPVPSGHAYAHHRDADNTGCD